MSYCRFRNTLQDLRDCNDALYDNDLSPEEHNARMDLIAMCREIVEQVEQDGEPENNEEDDEEDDE